MASAPDIARRGGGWVLESVDSIFTPEDFDDTTRELAKITRQFAERDVLPKLDRMEHGELELNVDLMHEPVSSVLFRWRFLRRTGALTCRRW